MNNFPFYNHFAIKMVLSETLIDKGFINELATKIVAGLRLTVVKESDFEFTEHGYTKVFILSQSHLIFHTWPENGAVHIDLMTCSAGIGKKEIEEIFLGVSKTEIRIQELIY